MGTSQRRERERERRRQQILIAARRVLVENGYGNTTMGNIAKEAELSPGTLYMYFDSKEELLASLPVRTLQYLLIRMEHTNEEVGASAVERLENLKNCFLGTYDFDPLVLINMFKLQSIETLQHISYELLTEITELARKILGRIIGVLSTSLNEEAFAAHHPNALADILWGLFSGVVLREEINKVINAKDDLVRAKFELAFEIFIRGLQAPQH
ncbi:TetR/AcrR family transcriptional regulator [Desulfosarcina alkanivorans]|nr:TetR/AcrR family transcriptional regulator [Desulfosarcina alkanivorans]